MARLSLRVFGPPAVQHGDRAVAFPTRKTLALLLYLAVEGGLVRRESLIALFWPESDAEHGQMALRRTLAYLRQSLATGAPPEHGPEHLVVAREALGFNFSAGADLDIPALQAAWTLARTPIAPAALPAGGLPPLLAQLQAAAGAYRGDFLAGFALDDAPDFDDWAGVQRETWHRRMGAVLDRLSQLQHDGGDLAGAIETTTRWVAHDPLDEAAHRRRMALYFAAGDRAAALRAYDACRETLERELNADPVPETLALAARIRAQTPPPAAGPGQDAPAELPDPPLVGRGAEHLALAAAYRTARRGRPHLAILEGEPGIGKTRLARAFLGWAAGQGARVLQGRAFEAGGRLPYQRIVDALAGSMAGPEEVQALLSPAWLAELGRLLPDLAAGVPAPAAPTDGAEAEARTRLFEAVGRLGQALAARAPLLLFIDDVQWAGSASRDLLHYLAHRWAAAATPVLLLLAARSEDLGSDPALAGWLADLGRDLPTTRLALGPLTAGDSLHLVQGLGEAGWPAAAPAGEDQALALSERLFRETAGQPFFIVETLKALGEREAPAGRPAGAPDAAVALAVQQYLAAPAGIPRGVQDLVGRRLAHLSPSARAVCTAGAVLGDGFSFEAARAVAGVEEADALTATDELLARQLIRESAGRYFFAHDKIRQVAYAEAGHARQRVFHRRALDVLQALQAAPAALAHHAFASGQLGPAFRFSLAAGDAALRVFAVREALAHYERAQAALDALPPVDRPAALGPADLQQLYTQLGRAAELTGEMDRAGTVYEAMLAVARDTAQPVMEGVALNRLATLRAQQRQDWPAARALLQTALRVAEASGDQAGLAQTHWNLAQINFYDWQRDAAVTHGTRALALARALGQPELIARSLNVLGYIQQFLGRWEEMHRYGEEARALFAGLGNRAMEADCLIQVGMAATNLGRPQAGIAAGRAALTISREIANPWGQMTSTFILAPALLDSGAYAEALAMARESVEVGRAHHIDLMRVFSLSRLGAVYRALFALDAAQAAHGEAQAVQEASPLPALFAEQTAADLCADYALAGAWDAAYAQARRALAARTPGTFGSGLTRWCETAALLHGGAAAEAAADVRRFGEDFGWSLRYRIPYLRACAVLAAAQGAPATALTHLQDAAAAAAAIDLPGELWAIEAAVSELHAAQGAAQAAREARERAAVIVRTLAGGIGDAELRTRFLDAAPVRGVLA